MSRASELYDQDGILRREPDQRHDTDLRVNIVGIRSASLLRIRDIGRVQLGSASYSGFSRVNGVPSGNLIVYLSPGANAVATSDRVR